MSRAAYLRGRQELAAVRARSRGLLVAVGIFSVFVNLLMLTGPLFMLQVYDRVLGSRSEATLAALVLLVAFLYLMMGLLDAVRSVVLTRIGARFQQALDARVFTASLFRASRDREARASASSPLRDLDAVQRLISSPVLGALFDFPFVPVFLFGIALFHPWLGALAVGGGALLIIITILNQTSTKMPMQRSMAEAQRAERFAQQLRDEAELVRSLGMQGAAFRRWQAARDAALRHGLTLQDRSGGYRTTSKTFRLFLQSAMLGLGAYLVLQNLLTPGAMIASSILMGRALQPVELVIGQWSAVQRARQGWNDLAELLGTVPPEARPTELPRPKARLQVAQLTVLPPGEAHASLRMLSFELSPGQALGVIGPSGAGKSTLARALTGVWRPASGKVRLDGAAIEQYDPETLGTYIGYLPQRVQLFEGTIAENIARLSVTPDDAAVVAAAQKAAAHEMILQLPQGYDTRVAMGDGRLSGGQLQRIGLARALYGSPVLLVLDEPNSNLDNEGSQALNAAIRQVKEEGGAVLIMAHRPAAIQECELLLVLEQGTRRAFGPRDQVLREMVQNSGEILRKVGPGGVA